MWMILLLLGVAATGGQQRQLKLVDEWKSIDFAFPGDHQRSEAIMRGDFVPGMAVPIDVDVFYKGNGKESKLFVTFPRFRTGIPITLGMRSTRKASDGSFLFEPFPDYSWHQNPTHDCQNKMISVFRIAIDACNRLWVVDTGKIGLAPSPQICPPKILVFNLHTNQLIHRYEIPKMQYTQFSLLVTPIVNVNDPPPGNCANTQAYFADVTGFGMVVYDAASDSSWRVENKLMYPYPNFGTHTISGESFELMDGILGVAIWRGGMFFHALAAEHENFVTLNALNNRTSWLQDENANPSAFTVLGPRGSQSAASAIDSNGNLFFGLNNVNALACWDTTRRPLTRAAVRTLIQDETTLQFASGMKVIRNSDGEEELWIVTNRFQKVFTGTLNNNEINFRVQAQRISQLLTGARCI